MREFWRRQGDFRLWLVALVAALVMLPSLRLLWPLVPGYLPPAKRAYLIPIARLALHDLGRDTTGCRANVEFDNEFSPDRLEYLRENFGDVRLRWAMAQGLPTISAYRVRFHPPGDAPSFSIVLAPNGSMRFWSMPEGYETGTGGDPRTARRLAALVLENHFGRDASRWWVREIRDAEGVFTGEIELSLPVRGFPGAFERVKVRVAKSRVIRISHLMEYPGGVSKQLLGILKAERTRKNFQETVQSIALGTMGICGGIAYLAFLLRLRDGTARLRLPVLTALIAFIGAASAWCLQEVYDSGDLSVVSWQALLSGLDGPLVEPICRILDCAWILFALSTVMSVADATERKFTGTQRGESLWCLLRGRFSNPQVGQSVIRGVAISLIAGGVMAAVVVPLVLCGGRASAQPQAFMLISANSPAYWALLYFPAVALLEEMLYRQFLTTWLLARTGNRIVAILVPAVIFGLTHTAQEFLPPVEPVWGRALVMSLVGCLWGWAFLRYDLLTVVVAHLIADLFIFNWPQIAGGGWSAVPPLLVVAAPAILAVPSLLRRRAASDDGNTVEDAGDTKAGMPALS